MEKLAVSACPDKVSSDNREKHKTEPRKGLIGGLLEQDSRLKKHLRTVSRAEKLRIFTRDGFQNFKSRNRQIWQGKPTVKRSQWFEGRIDIEVQISAIRKMMEQTTLRSEIIGFDLNLIKDLEALKGKKTGPQGGMANLYELIEGIVDYYNEVPFSLNEEVAKEAADHLVKEFKDRLREQGVPEDEWLIKIMNPIGVIGHLHSKGRMTASAGNPINEARKTDASIQQGIIGVLKDSWAEYPANIGTTRRKLKDRLYWAYPFSANIYESMYRIPLVQLLKKAKHPAFVYKESLRAFEHTLTAIWDQNSIATAFDWNSMDKHFKLALMEWVFYIYKHFVPADEHDNLWRALKHMCEIELLLHSKYKLSGEHGVASGSAFTNDVECMASAFIHTIFKLNVQVEGLNSEQIRKSKETSKSGKADSKPYSLNNTNYKFAVNGDDTISIVKVPQIWSDSEAKMVPDKDAPVYLRVVSKDKDGNRVETYETHTITSAFLTISSWCGLPMNLEKQTSSHQYVDFCQRRYIYKYRRTFKYVDDHGKKRSYRVIVGVYSVSGMLNSILNPQWEFAKDWNLRKDIVRTISILENGANHPWSTGLIEFVSKGRAGNLGRDIPGFFSLENLKLMDKLRKDKRTITSWNQQSEELGFANYDTVIYLMESKGGKFRKQGSVIDSEHYNQLRALDAAYWTEIAVKHFSITESDDWALADKRQLLEEEDKERIAAAYDMLAEQFRNM